MNIDGISGGVSGLPESFLSQVAQTSSGDYLAQVSEHKVPRACDSIWIFFQGKSIRLAFLSFGSESELKRVCQNIYKYNNPGQLSDTNGYKINEMKDGSRVVVVRPSFSETWAFFVRKFDVKRSTLEQWFKGEPGCDDSIALLKYLVKGARIISITGEQGCGKTTMLMGMIENIYETMNIRVQETAFELHLRKIYPTRNILTFRETDTISGQEGLDVQKKTDGSVNIIGEVATDPVASWMIQAAQVASKFTLFTHHAKTFPNLVTALRNSMLRTGVFKNEKTAEEQVVQVLNFDIHLKKDFKGKRYVERITECIPIESRNEYTYDHRKKKTLEGKFDKFFDNATQYFTKTTDKELYQYRNILEYVDGEYKITNPITNENIVEMRNNMDDSDREEFDQFIEKHWKKVKKRKKNHIIAGGETSVKPSNIYNNGCYRNHTCINNNYIYNDEQKMQKSEYKQLQKLRQGTKANKFSAEILYQKLYVTYMKIPFIKRYVLKLRRRLEIINIDDEYNTRRDASKVLTKALAILIPVVIVTIFITKNNYLLMFILLLFELFMVDILIDGSVDKIDDKLLKQQITFFSEIRHAYHEFNMVEEAIYQVSQDDEMDVSRQGEKIYEILISDDPETELEKYYDIAPNSYLKEFAGVSYLTKEFGDRKVDGASLYLKNVDNITQEMQLEILKRDKLNYVFQSLSVIAIVPVLLLEPLKSWAISNFGFVESWYNGKPGTIVQIAVLLITFISYILVRKLKDNGSTNQRRQAPENPWQAKVYKNKIFKKIVNLVMPKEGTKDYRKLKRLLQDAASNLKMEWVYVNRITLAIIVFIVSLLLFLYLHHISIKFVYEEPTTDYDLIGGMTDKQKKSSNGTNRRRQHILGKI